MSDIGNKTVFSENLKRYMDRKGINQTDLCADLDLKFMTVSDWVNAKTYPRIDKIERLAAYFGILKSDLIERHTESGEVNALLKRLMAAGGKLPKDTLEPFVLALEAAAKACEKK